MYICVCVRVRVRVRVCVCVCVRACIRAGHLEGAFSLAFFSTSVYTVRTCGCLCMRTYVCLHACERVLFRFVLFYLFCFVSLNSPNVCFLFCYVF